MVVPNVGFAPDSGPYGSLGRRSANSHKRTSDGLTISAINHGSVAERSGAAIAFRSHPFLFFRGSCRERVLR